MPASQPATFNLQEFTDLGQPLVGGRLYTYAYGTTAQKTAFTDPDGTVPHTYTADGAGGQYIALNARGELPAPLYLGDGSYDISLKRADGSMVWTRKADGVENSIKSQLAASLGAALIGFIQAIAGAIKRTLLDKLRESVSLDDFEGIDATGATDSTAGVLAAFAWLAAGNRRLHGSSGAQYKVSQSIPVRGHFVTFDGRNCIIINAINGPGGGAGADPLFAITAPASGAGFIEVCNIQPQYDVAANKGHTVSIIGDGANPQAIYLRNIKPYGQIGTGKDHSGAAMDACTVYAYGVYSVHCDEIYAQSGSGGLYFDTVQKVNVRRNVLDSTPNYGMKFDGCASVVVDGMNIVSGCGQAAQAGVYYDNCESFVFRGNRVKAGAGSEIMAGPNASRSVTIADNHFEIYTANKNAIYAKTNTDSLTIADNYIKFIGGYGPFAAGICVDDTGIGPQSHGSIVIRSNKIVVGGAETLADGIVLAPAVDQVNGAVIESNTIGDLHCTMPTITNAIRLSGTGTGNRVESNTIGAPNVTVTNGIVIGAQLTATKLDNNQDAGTVTNPIVDNGVRTRQYGSGAFNLTLQGCTTTPQVGCVWERQGRTVTLKILEVFAASSSVTCQLTGLPANLQPGSTQIMPVPLWDNGLTAPGWAQLTQNGTVSLFKTNPSVAGEFTNGGGNKGIRPTTIVYQL